LYLAQNKNNHSITAMTGSEVGVFSISALDGVGGQHQTLATLPLLKDPGTNCRVYFMGPIALWMGMAERKIS
jgi:hypothetical protein